MEKLIFYFKLWNLTRVYFFYSINKYRIWLKNLLINSLNPQVGIAVIPFVFGIYQVVWSRYIDQPFYFVEKNVPGSFIPFENLSWETFEYIKSKNINLDELSRIDMYNDSFLIQFRENPKQYSIATFPSKQKKHLWYQISNQQLVGFFPTQTKHLNRFLNELFFKNFFYNLDEFPSKLESSFFNNQKNFTIPIVDLGLTNQKNQQVKKFDKNTLNSIFLENQEKSLPKFSTFEKIFSVKNKNIENKNLFFRKFNAISFNENKKLSISNQSLLKINTLLNNNVLENQKEFLSFQKKYNFYKKYKFLQQQFKKEFYNNGLYPINSFTFSKNFDFSSKDFDFSEYSSKDVLSLISQISKIEKNILIKPRLMSGYKYPDMKLNTVKLLGIKYYYFNSKSNIPIKINLPSSFVSSFVYNLPYLNIPNIDIKYQPTLLTGLRPGDILYQGPGILETEKTKDIVLSNNDQVKKWSRFYFGHKNPLTDRRDAFFGKSRKKLKKNLSFYFTNEKNKKTFETLEKAVLKNKNLNFIFDSSLIIDYQEKEQVPFIDQKEWQLGIDKIKQELEESELKQEDINEEDLALSFPLIKIFYPLKNPIDWPLNLVDYHPFDSSKLVNYFQKSKNLDQKISLYLHYLPSSRNLVNQYVINKTRFGYFNEKTFSFYKNDLTTNSLKSFFIKEFHNSWEPISTNSWLVFTQIYVGLFIWLILQELYKSYGKELISYLIECAALLGVIDDDLREKIEASLGKTGYRVIKKVKRSFDNIAGIDTILPKVGELVWFLRNSGRSFNIGKTIPKGLLLIGPPGTGKTLLVQAIAGEAEVPVLVESGSSLIDPQQKQPGAERLKNLFYEARQLAPCIVFIDEIDTLGEKRQQLLQNPMGEDELVESLYQPKPPEVFEEFVPKPLIQDDENTKQEENKLASAFGQLQQKMKLNKKRASLLMQFLIEMDGVKIRDKVIVIGATNRPAVLDSALTRPGRFDEIINLELPNKEKRIEILKLYSKNLGIENNISWDYLGNRTAGFSAADLSSLMNESAMFCINSASIVQDAIHTVKTIERGIDLVTNSNREKPKLKNIVFSKTDPFYIKRLAYYQAGKAVLHSLLPKHPPVVFLDLGLRKKNKRELRFIQTKSSDLNTRIDLENQMIGYYAGKASELLLLSSNFDVKREKFYWQSDLGREDLTAANSLAHLMISKWFFYSKRLVSRSFTQLVNDYNEDEIKKFESIVILKVLADEIEEQRTLPLKEIEFQKKEPWFLRPSWQLKVTEYASERERDFYEWYRLFLPNPEEIERNDEWIPPDEYYHNTDRLKSFSKKYHVPINDLYKIDHDYIYQGLILSCFNKAFSVLDEFREFLDYFAYSLISNGLLRQDDIFEITKKINKKDSFDFSEKDIKLKTKILEKSWGKNSRRKISKFINFEKLKPVESFFIYKPYTLYPKFYERKLVLVFYWNRRMFKYLYQKLLNKYKSLEQK